MTLRENIIATSAPASSILIRLVVGGVFLSEGVQKFRLPGGPQRDKMNPI